MGRGRRARGRNVTGILLLDKASGLSSNAALQEVKRLFDAQKAGHTGSLDPLATGLLPICFGQATKLSGYLLDADKAYQVRAKLGEKTDTADAEGEVIEQQPVPEITAEKLQTVLTDFLGEQSQIPPMHSALKKDGKRLYEIAREGGEVERKPRQITIYDLQLLRFSADELVLSVRCSKGTYIRTLVEDIAEALGTVAHVADLRRTAVGAFCADKMVDFDSLQHLALEGSGALDAVLLPMSDALSHWPAVALDADSSFYFLRGQAVQVSNAPTSGLLRVHDVAGDFVGVGEIDADGRVAPKRILKDRS